MPEPEILSGYRDKALEILENGKVKIGDLIRVEKEGETYEGTLMPRTELGDPHHIVIKLKNGYNTGIKVTAHTKVNFIGSGTKPSFVSPPKPQEKAELPLVTIVSTGGTIASRVDYRTGAVHPALSAEDLHTIVPEISNLARIKAKILYSLFSEHISPKHWSEIAKTVGKEIEEGTSGVVVAHGTDTMAYTAAALSFAIQETPVPIVLVGSQRSSDRPSSDAASNLLGAITTAAHAPFSEVAVAMHEGTSDETISIHRGTCVRKCHTSRRDAFKSINTPPIAKIIDGKISMLTEDYRHRSSYRKLRLKPNFNDKVCLIKMYPGFHQEILEWLVDQKFLGIVMEGTGLGHINHECYEALEEAVKRGIVVAMTSQCLWGRTRMTVYDTGRDLLNIGVIPLQDILPETALVKMMWI
ncbi:MAG: Glu-tRNA(Gln) amidotransferase subunit GatD, partial [Candidatus Bathyarchaeota archaeon]